MPDFEGKFKYLSPHFFFYRKFVETNIENRTFILSWLSHNCRRNLSLEKNDLTIKQRKEKLP